MLKPLVAAVSILLVAGCAERDVAVPVDTINTAPEVSPGPQVAPGVDDQLDEIDVMRRDTQAGLTSAPRLGWSNRPEGARWTAATFTALRGHGAVLPATVPEGIEAWCPAYDTAPRVDREAFWAGFLSALVKHESTYRPAAVGGDGRWFGLTQIGPATAENYGCRARTGAALKDGAANLSCAVRIMATRARSLADGSVRTIAGDWGPLHQPAKREDMRAWVASQPFCVEG